MSIQPFPPREDPGPPGEVPGSPASGPAGRLRAWREVDTGALVRNLEAIRTLAATPEGERPRAIVMMKADGYGLGVQRVVKTLGLLDTQRRPRGIAATGVASVSEGIELRSLGVRCPILVFTPLLPEEIPRILAADLVPLVSNISFVRELDAAAVRAGVLAPFHVEVDTGMGRSGLPAAEVDAWGPELARVLTGREGPGAGSGAVLTGLCHHFHSADDAPETMAEQDAAFQAVCNKLDGKPGFEIGGDDGIMIHRAASAAALRQPVGSGEVIRPGLFLYGGRSAADLPAPDPVLTVRARVVRVVDVPPGTPAGYGATYRARRPERWATLPVGYGDGIPRALSHRARALLHGRSVPMVGRISMDMVVVDTTDVPHVSMGDTATLLGRDGDEEITLDEIAGHAGTIGYEILTGLGARLPGIDIDHGGPSEV